MAAPPGPSASSGGDDYWDVDSILAEAEKVPVIFRTDVNRTGGLGGYHEQKITAGSQLDVPFYMVESLAINNFVDMLHPKPFNATNRRSIRASATNVNLHRLSPYFYAFGIRMTDIIDDGDLSQVLVKCFKERLEPLMYYAHGPGGADALDFISMLDETEIKLYRTALQSHHAMRKWINRDVGQLGKAEALRNPRQHLRGE